MSSDINKINANDLLVRLEGKSSLLAGQNSVPHPKSNSKFADELSSALTNLSSIENSEKLREDAIANGKAIIKNWQPPTDEQIDKIFLNMRNELSSRSKVG
ncbi:MAG: hypothetical protein A4E65_00088 [Syntrophorhabdus sp. PtaU1.Bin153]|nr:MAG: hypothetical protein A4E65_00088 [Syntrophorhabdus sp. PtaU1.Bin153]